MAEIQARRVTSPSVAQKSGGGDFYMLFVERDDFRPYAAKKGGHPWTGVLTQAPAQDHRGFQNSRSSNYHQFGTFECIDQPDVAGSSNWMAAIAELSRTIDQKPPGP